MRRQQIDFVYFGKRALGINIEGTQGVDFVIQKIYAIGSGTAHGKEIHDGPAAAEFTVGQNLLDLEIALLR